MHRFQDFRSLFQSLSSPSPTNLNFSLVAPSAMSAVSSSFPLGQNAFPENLAGSNEQGYYYPDDLTPRITHSESHEDFSYSQGSGSDTNLPLDLLDTTPDFGSQIDFGGVALKFNSCKLDQDVQLVHHQQHQVFLEHAHAQELMQRCFKVEQQNLSSFPSFEPGHPAPERRHSLPNLRNVDVKYFSEKRARMGSPTTLTIDTKLTQVNAPMSGEDVYFYKDATPDTDDLSYSDSLEDEDFLPAPPNTRVMDNKPRRGGRHKKDGKPKEELLPPPSPRTLNDPNLMQDYRQERNRLAAKRSRERKKDYIKQLETTCKALKNHGEELSRELIKAKKELAELRGKTARKKSIS